MLRDQLDIFTDRSEVIALFDLLRGRDPNEPWPLLPILTFIAPGGSGKSTLIEFLRAKKCCLPDGRAAVPYAQLDFTQTDAPKTLLSILVALRNQLQQHDDGQGQHLVFPRFDLGAAIALSTPADGNLPLMNSDEIQSRLGAGKHLIESLAQGADALRSVTSFFTPLSNVTQVIPSLLVGLKLALQIPSVQELILRIEKGSGWKWYRAHSSDVGLPANAGIREVLLRLYDLSIPGKSGKQGKEYMVGRLLPNAFVADLRDELNSPRAWSKTANVVLFLDGYEALMDDPSNIGMRLLEVLTLTEHRERGETDPLLLVLGSRQHLFKPTIENRDQFSESLNAVDEDHIAGQHAQALYKRWMQRLPDDKSYLELHDLHLPIWLHDFSLADTHNYLMQLDQQRQSPIFAEKAMVQAIHRITYGHPLYLALAAAAILTAQARHQKLNLDEFEQAMVSRKIIPGHEHEQIRDYLLTLFLRQLPDSEQKELIFCAVPRVLNVATLRAVLQLPSDLEAQERWNRYRNLTFVRAIDEKSMVVMAT